LDIPRAPKPKRGPWLYVSAVILLVVATVGFSRMRPAAPTVERATLWIDKVRQGPMLRQVRGSGTLVPERIRWISAVTAGRVERILVHAGETVDEKAVLLELVNPDVQLEALDAERQLTLAEAELASLDASLQNNVLAQEGVVATTHTELMDATRGAAGADKLAAEGLISGNELDRARDRASEMKTRYEGEQKRLEVMRGTVKTQLGLQRAQVGRLKAISAFHQGRVASMRVVAGARGVVQDMSLEEGQWVNPGALLAKVAQPERLKAVLRVPETQAKDIGLGQRASIDTHNGVIAGRVARIDPSVQDGTVAVDVGLDGALPQGARPDLSVDGVIEIERLANVLYVGRPVDGQANATIGVFKLSPGGKEASRVNVRLGKISVNTVEVVQGLAAGDEVILSDMSRWDGVSRVRLR
jgi:multidrug resistance efflux pump